MKIEGRFRSVGKKIQSICALLFLLAVLTLQTSPAMAVSTWQPVGEGLPNNPTSLFVYKGTPYVSYVDTSGKATVVEYNGTSWQPVGNSDSSSSQADWVSLFVYDGTPYLAFRDEANDCKFTVMEYDGRAWTPVGAPVGIAASPGYGSTIYDSFYVYQGTPYLASEDGSGIVTVMEYAGGSAGWRQVGGTIDYKGNWYGLFIGYPGVLAPVSLVVYEGTPYIAVGRTVVKYDGTAWEPVSSADFLSIKTDYESLFVYDGIPYVAYQSQLGGGGIINGVLEVPRTSGVMEYNGTSWVPVGSFDSSYACQSLYVYNGTPYVACTDDIGKITVMEYGGTSWQPVGNPGFSSSQVASESLFVYEGTPLVAYSYIGADHNYHGTVMEYTCPPAITTPIYAGTDVSVSGSAAPGATIILSVNGTEQSTVMADDSSGDWTVNGLTLHAGDTVSVAAQTPAEGGSQTTTALVTAASASAESVQVTINGSPLQLDVPPVIINGRVMVPLRAIFEALGATVQWNPVDQSIVATKGNTAIRLQIGSTAAFNNGVQVTLDAAPQIEGGRTLVPVRFVGEALGAEVTWDGTNRQVNIVTAGP
jgi:hypothetical protein